MKWKRHYGARRMGVGNYEVWVWKEAGEVYHKAAPGRFLAARSATRVAQAIEAAYNDGLWAGSDGELPLPGDR